MMNNVAASKKYSGGVTFYDGSVSHALRQFSETCESVDFFCLSSMSGENGSLAWSNDGMIEFLKAVIDNR